MGLCLRMTDSTILTPKPYAVHHVGQTGLVLLVDKTVWPKLKTPCLGFYLTKGNQRSSLFPRLMTRSDSSMFLGTNYKGKPWRRKFTHRQNYKTLLIFLGKILENTCGDEFSEGAAFLVWMNFLMLLSSGFNALV